MKHKSIGEQIRYYRMHRGLTQQQLAKSIGVTWEMISRYERGVSSSLGKLESIANSLEVDPVELLQKSYKSDTLLDGQGGKIPLFTSIPKNYDFENGITQYYYSAPDWILEVDPSSFLIDAKVPIIKSVQLKDSGPIYISPKSTPNQEDMILFQRDTQLYIDRFANSGPHDKVIGVVLAQEYRYR